MAIADPLNYIGENEDLSGFIKQVSENTGDFFEQLWLDNARANKPLVKKQGWASDVFQGIHKGKTSILLGASPAIKNQIDILKELREDPRFIFIGLSSNIDFLFDNGIYPNYVMVAEASPETERFWKKTDFSLTKDVTLISALSVHPYLLEKWQGDIKFLALYTTIDKLDEKFASKRWFGPINGCGQYFSSLFSQYNTAAAVAFTIFETSILIFVGNELSFSTNEAKYYVDREDLKDEWDRHPQVDINGEQVYTTTILMSLKLVLEDFLGKISEAGWFFNCTEAGIFGVTAKHGNLPWIHQLKLTTGIAQARQIMRTGEPFYL